MPDNPALGGTITNGTLRTITCTSRSKLAAIIPQDTAAPGFIESNPVLNFPSECLKNDPSIVREIGNEFLFIEEAPVASFQFQRQIPVEEGDHRSDSRREEGIY